MVLYLEGARTESLVERHRGLAKALALRAARPGDDADDLVQVAMVGLVLAERRFDPDRGVEFSTFAYATISGELKRYRRATTWSVHVPRKMQEGYLRVAAAIEELSHELGRQPTVPEVADRASVTVEEAIRYLDMRDARRPASLDETGDEGSPRRDVADRRDGFEGFERESFVTSLIHRLNERERTVVVMRFFDDLTQQEIGQRLGISQMHVSRLLRQALDKLRVFAAA